MIKQTKEDIKKFSKTNLESLKEKAQDKGVGYNRKQQITRKSK